VSVHHFEHLRVDENLNFNPKIKERKHKLVREERYVDLHAFWPPRLFIDSSIEV
jgi:hypothetical protein